MQKMEDKIKTLESKIESKVNSEEVTVKRIVDESGKANIHVNSNTEAIEDTVNKKVCEFSVFLFSNRWFITINLIYPIHVYNYVFFSRSAFSDFTYLLVYSVFNSFSVTINMNISFPRLVYNALDSNLFRIDL
jgi:hypothetical protein